MSRTSLVIGAFLLRALLALQPYSGYNTPPMYGDFEAQRHWQEITVNIPISDWYTNTSDNDLLYWGLDYPPLTAYHSWLMGTIARHVNASYVELHTSRGITTDEHKNFMRTTVLVADVLIYLPALLIAIGYVLKSFTNHSHSNLLCNAIALLYPGQILIDNGHFQYNNISLGLTCLAITAILGNKNRLAAVFFVFALNYKQMELYHALPFFCYLLAKCFANESNLQVTKTIRFVNGLKKLALLGFIVIFLFAIIWLHWIESVQLVLQTVHRIFPIARGVFEDKVSNVWCLVNIIYKIKDHFTNEQMAVICLSCTLLAVLPSSLHLFFNHGKDAFILSLINSSLAFFLFSFQVHEKTILLVALPVVLYFAQEPLVCLWFLQISTFSMIPLLVKDNLVMSFVVLNLFYLLIIRLILTMSSTYDRKSRSKWDVLQLYKISESQWTIGLFYLSTVIGCSILTCLHLFVTPPLSLPFLFPLLISVYSCCHFLIFFLYFNFKQLSSSLNKNSVSSFGTFTYKYIEIKSVTAPKKHV